MKDVLIINSYAGSLVIGTQSAGYAIRGSYEDSGFGIDAQKLNFPDLNFKKSLPWPDDDLTDTIVMSHPPCAAFSNQNSSKSKRGVNTDAFECHRRVMTYALGHNAAALSIESVPGVIEASPVYAQYAEKFGYNYCQIFLNSISFNVPQWRPRIWTLFFRKDLNLPFFRTWFEPKYKSIGEITDPNYEPDQIRYVPGGGDRHSGPGRLLSALLKRAINQIDDFEGYINSDELGAFAGGYARYKDIEIGSWPELRKIVGPGWFATMLPRKLSLVGFAPTLMHQSFWFVNNRPMVQREYMRVMGFPDSFQWPEKMNSEFRLYLSKGVCPPVAEFIVSQLQHNIESPERASLQSCEWGEVLDLRPKKAAVEEHLAKPNTAPAPKTWQAVKPETLMKSKPEIETVVDEVNEIPLEVLNHAAHVEDECCLPDATGDSTPEPIKPKFYAQMVGFVGGRPENGKTYEYKDGAMLPIETITFQSDELVASFDRHGLVRTKPEPLVKSVTIKKPGPGAGTKRPRAMSEELKRRATCGYTLAPGTKSDQWEEGAHAFGIVKAIELRGDAITRDQIVESISRNNLIKTTMPVERAVAWMLNELVKKGKVIQS